jgi:hypothetical protein
MGILVKKPQGRQCALSEPFNHFVSMRFPDVGFFVRHRSTASETIDHSNAASA